MATLLDGWQTLLNDIQGMHVDPDEGSDVFWDLVVASKIDATWDHVNFISMDDHFDSQRRRQHQSPAVRATRTISH